jgi:hypothetical protein
MTYRFLIIDSTDSAVNGTDDEALATSLSADENFIVIAVANMTVFNPDTGEETAIQEFS